MSDTRKRASLEGVMPFFIVSRLQAALEFYVEHLGFAIEVCIPEEAPYFAIVCRDRVGIMLKEIGKEIQPQPNHTRHGWARWAKSRSRDRHSVEIGNLLVFPLQGFVCRNRPGWSCNPAGR